MSYASPILILPCSGPKLTGPQLAIDKYTGTSVWGLLRSSADWERLKYAASIYIVSAEHGLLRWCDTVDDYDTAMTPQRADYLRARPGASRHFRMHCMPLPTRTPIYVALPKSYREVVLHWAGGFKGHPNVHCYPAGAGIGVQRQYLKRWMQEIVSL